MRLITNKTSIISILIFISFLLIFSYCSTCIAQDKTITPDKTEKKDPEKVRIGLKGGVNFSTLYSKDADKTKMRTGFNLGLFAKLPVTSFFAFQPELYYTNKGAEVTYNNNSLDGTANFKINYLELPVIMVVNITEYFNVQAGAYASMKISGKVTNVSNINLFNFENNLDSHDFSNLDAGIIIGTGIDIGAVSLGFRYNQGLTRVSKGITFNETSYMVPDASNGVINFYISLSLN